MSDPNPELDAVNKHLDSLDMRVSALEADAVPAGTAPAEVHIRPQDPYEMGGLEALFEEG